jgi:hypothetical protein
MLTDQMLQHPPDTAAIEIGVSFQRDADCAPPFPDMRL